ncbi:MAG: HAMP domain-containing histidine kinase [Myxococcales bacterium]|nr:HAMP domain-containing histidine kinase [Myxococcales bacterium]
MTRPVEDSESFNRVARRGLYPAFVAEMGLPTRRKFLIWGVRSGYVFSLLWPALAFLAEKTGIIPHEPRLYALVGGKLLVNAANDLALRRDRFALELSGLNIAADVVLLTAGIHLTGGPLSPLFVAYVIEICVLALLANRGVTVLLAAFAWVCHTATLVLTHVGVLSQHAPPATTVEPFTTGQVALAIGFAGMVLAVSTLFTTSLTSQLQAERRALEQRTRELIEAGTQKSHFLANVTHELRTPLHGIMGLTDLLSAGIYGPITKAQREAHEGIRESSRALLRMVDDLLTLAKAEAGALKVKPAPFDVEELVETVVASVRWMVGTKNIELEVERDIALPDGFVSDRGRVAQVLVNLLANAVKFTPEGGVITLEVQTHEDAIAFAVRDTGIGIAPEHLERIFEPFSQVDGSDEREYGGVGLGLPLVRRLVDALEGSITLDSAIGEGTTFHVTLPCLGQWPDVDTLVERAETSGARRIA